MNLKNYKMKNLLIEYNRFNNGHSVLYIQSERLNFYRKIYFSKRIENKEKHFSFFI